MSPTVENLPDDIGQLKALIIDYHARCQREALRVELLEEQIALLHARLFGRRSEKYILDNFPGQERLPGFEGAKPPPVDEKEETVAVPAHTRKKSGRKPLPDSLPRKDVVHDISEQEKVCTCGCTMTRIGEDVSEQLQVEPPKFTVIRNIRPKYACRSCEGIESDRTVWIAPPPPQVIPKSFATPSLLAWIITGKFVDSLPLYRQENRFRRYGIDLSRATMSSWMARTAALCVPLLSLLIEEIRSGPLINSDESTFQVMGEPGRKNTSTSYIWVFRGGPMDRPAVIYQYEPTRSSSVPNTFFAGYKGYVQVDGYAGYDALDRTDGITLVGCWAHARRKFDEAAKANRKGKKSKMRAADIALRYIRQLYAVEHEAEGLEPDERRQLRQAKAWPMLTEFGDWLRQTYPQTPPKGLPGKAIHYTLQQWERLTVYLEDGRLKPDNNLAENAIRPFVVGRKNWLFAGSPDGARASALLYSLVETAKLNGLEPYHYIHFLLEKIIVAKERDDFLDLLPNRVRKEEVDSFPFFLPDSR